MQSKSLHLTPKLSKLWFAMVLMMTLTAIATITYFNNYLGILFILIYTITDLYCLKNYTIDITTSSNKIILWRHNNPYPAKLINCYQITCILTLVTLQYAKQTVTFPIFIDSLSLTQYKQLRMFIQWS